VVLESVDREPELVAERDGLVHPPAFEIVTGKTFGDGPMDDVLVFRALATDKGDLKDFKVLNDPLGIAEKLGPAHSWYPWTILDEQVRRISAVVGYGMRPKYVPTDDAVLTPVAISGGLRIELEVEPLPEERGGGDPDRYVLSVYVKRVEDGEIISAPRISGRRGEEAKIRSSVSDEDGRQSLLEMSFLVSRDGTEIEYSWTLSRDGVVLEAHRADLKL
jgi:hypothetical protein